MITEIVYYKDKMYNVTNPGELVYSTINYVRGCRTDKRFEILDQLNNCSEITYNKKGCESRVRYLETKYNLTELEYYIIVVCRGDESLLPRCTYINPYTGEKCDKPKKFRSLNPGLYQRTKNERGFFTMDVKTTLIRLRLKLLSVKTIKEELLVFKKQIGGQRCGEIN